MKPGKLSPVVVPVVLGALLHHAFVQVHQAIANPTGMRLISSPAVLFSVYLKGMLLALTAELFWRWVAGASPRSLPRALPGVVGLLLSMLAAFGISIGFVALAYFRANRSVDPEALLIFGKEAMLFAVLYWLCRLLWNGKVSALWEAHFPR